MLLLDEPFSSLDASLREMMRAEVAAIVRHVGVTTVFVTHDQDEALSIADVIAVMSAGRIIETASPRGNLQAPAPRIHGGVRRGVEPYRRQGSRSPGTPGVQRGKHRTPDHGRPKLRGGSGHSGGQAGGCDGRPAAGVRSSVAGPAGAVELPRASPAIDVECRVVERKVDRFKGRQQSRGPSGRQCARDRMEVVRCSAGGERPLMRERFPRGCERGPSIRMRRD